MHATSRADLGVGALYRNHHAFVRTCLRRFHLHEADLDDTVQDVFAAMLGRAGEQLDRSRAVRPWLLGISRNMAFSARRRGARRSRLLARAPEATPAPTPDEHVERSEASQLLAQFLERLDPEKLAPFVLLDVEGLPARDVAERLALPVTTVRWRARAARAELERLASERSPGRLSRVLVWLWPWHSARIGPWVAWLVAVGLLLAWLVGPSRPASPPAPTSAAGPEMVARASAEATTARSASPSEAPSTPWRIDPRAATVAGRVLDEGGQPIADALVCRSLDVTERRLSDDVEPTCTRSDAGGRYHLTGVLSGLYRIGASAQGFLPADHPGERGLGHLVVAASTRHTGIDIVLRRGGARVEGTVVDETGGVVGGAVVRSQDFTRFGQGWTAVTTADDEGRFTLWVPRGGVALEASAEGYATTRGHANAPQDSIELRIMPEVVLVGRVIDRAGAPVADIRVRANPESHNAHELFAFTTTDVDGRFELRRLGPGRYRPTAEGPTAFGQAPAMVTLAFGEPAPAVEIVTGPAATVDVEVQAPAALDGCEGDWLEGFVETHRYAARILGARATLHGVAPGPLELVASCRGTLTQVALELPEVERFEARVLVDASTTVGGRVPIGEEGLGSFMSVRLVPAGRVLDGPMLPEGTVLTVTDASGRFVAATRRGGEYQVLGSTAAGATLPLWRSTVTLVEGEHTDLGLLELPALGHIEGRVVDPDGHGVGGLHVVALRTAGLGGLTRADGSVSMRQLVPGDYVLEVRQELVPLVERPHTVTVTAGETTRVVLSVPRLDGVVTGVVVDPDGQPVPDAEVSIATLDRKPESERPFRVVASVQADAEGRFTRAELLPGDYELEATALVGEGNERPGCQGRSRVAVKATPAPAAVVTCR